MNIFVFSYLANMECIACPISWNKLSAILGVSKHGVPHEGDGNVSINTTTGFCKST
jgi:hypothetical protein